MGWWIPDGHRTGRTGRQLDELIRWSFHEVGPTNDVAGELDLFECVGQSMWCYGEKSGEEMGRVYPCQVTGVRWWVVPCRRVVGYERQWRVRGTP